MRARLLFAALLLAPGCDVPDKPATQGDKPTQLAAKPADKPAENPPPATKPSEKPAEKPVEGKKTALNKQSTLFMEIQPGDKRRILIESTVCLREGALELLMCRRETKEHESILHAEIDAREIHMALLAAKAKPGSVVKYTEDGKIFPPTGTKIKITLRYERKPGEFATVDAKEWVRNLKTKKALEYDWVFAGSQFWQDPEDAKKPPYYLANGGDVITVSNFPDAMLDLPINSPKDNSDLAFEAWTERIPPVGTKVTMILEPVLEEKK
jgi:hypothetical protein